MKRSTVWLLASARDQSPAHDCLCRTLAERLPYMREEALGEHLGQILKNIHIPDQVLTQLQDSLAQDSRQLAEETTAQRIRLEQRLSAVRRRIDQAYLDKLDGKISEIFWAEKNAEWQEEANGIELALVALGAANPDRLLTANRILELANKAYSLYLRQNAANSSVWYFRTAPSMRQVSIPPTENPLI